jgi:positive regulator of sigma E activity
MFRYLVADTPHRVLCGWLFTKLMFGSVKRFMRNHRGRREEKVVLLRGKKSGNSLCEL